MSLYARSETRGESSGSNFGAGEGPFGRDRYSRREPSNGHRGPTTIDLPCTGYSVDVYKQSAYVAERMELAQKAEILVVRSGLWTPSTAHEMITRALDRSDPQNTSWIGFRKTDSPRGEYDGFTWQEGIVIPTTQRDSLDIHMMIRTFDPGIQGQGFGKLAMQIMRTLYPDADTIDHRSGNPVAVDSWLGSRVFRPGRRFPYDHPFEEDDEMSQVVLWLWSRFHTRGKMLDFSTGVSKGDYIEPNGAIPQELRGHTREVYLWMTGKKNHIEIDGKRKRALGMDLPSGDALYEVGDLA